MGVVIEICIKYPGGRTRIRGTDIYLQHPAVSATSNCARYTPRTPSNSAHIRIPGGKRLTPAPAFFWWWMSKIEWGLQKWCRPSGSAPSLLFHQDCLLSPERHARGWQHRNRSRRRLSEMRWAHVIAWSPMLPDFQDAF